MFQQFVLRIVDTFRVFREKPSMATILGHIMATLPAVISDVIRFGGMTSKEKFDVFLQGIDDFTGTEAQALDVFKDIPAEAEEKFWDAIKEAARVIGYNQLRVEGFYVPEVTTTVTDAPAFSDPGTTGA